MSALTPVNGQVRKIKHQMEVVSSRLEYDLPVTPRRQMVQRIAAHCRRLDLRLVSERAALNAGRELIETVSFHAHGVIVAGVLADFLREEGYTVKMERTGPSSNRASRLVISNPRATAMT